MHASDRAGRPIEPGDTVVFGADNGSTLTIGMISKITPQFVWMSVPYDRGDGRTYTVTYRRAYDRVCKIEGGTNDL